MIFEQKWLENENSKVNTFKIFTTQSTTLHRIQKSQGYKGSVKLHNYIKNAFYTLKDFD
jgi:hypothetical protein